MPGASYRGPLPPLSDAQRALADELRAHVEVLAGQIGERNVFNPQALERAAEYIEEQLAAVGYDMQRQAFQAAGTPCRNLIVEVPGTSRPDEIIVVGAHYDSVYGSPGANDNASGVAALLALAQRFAGRTVGRTLRFAAFANEEQPWFQSAAMGSLVYARSCRQRGDRIVGMISLETIGYYSDVPGSQRYPPLLGWFYPSAGNFAAFVSNFRSRAWVRRVIRAFRRHAQVPSQGASVPWLPQVSWSDHSAFWKYGYAGLMITDTAPFRYPYYHTAEDTPDKLDYQRIARLVSGLEAALADLAGAD